MDLTANRQQVRRVLLITLVLNLSVAGGKIFIGLATGALAITADGLHSLIDGAGNVAGLLATRLADKPPDADHPYGHTRFETLAALAIGGLLLLTALEVARGVIERLSGGELPVLTPLAFAVMLVTLAINIGVSRYQIRAGRQLNSQVLLADAANTSADVFVTLAVLVSMALVALAGWTWADVVAALVITVLIARAAWQVLSQAGQVLVDAAPYDADQLAAWAQKVPAVERVLRVRSRGTADTAYIDIDIQVQPETTAAQADAIASAVREKLAAHVDFSEVKVHFVPDYAGEPNHAQVARACADALGLGTHEVRVSEGPAGRVLEMHVEVPAGQTLDAAHDQVSQLERDIQLSLPDLAEIITHIEPAQAEPSGGDHDQDAARTADKLAGQALRLLQQHYADLDWHDLRVYPDDDGFAAVLHVTLPPQITVEAAHRVAEDAETLLRTRLPGLARVTIHTEPPDDLSPGPV